MHEVCNIPIFGMSAFHPLLYLQVKQLHYFYALLTSLLPILYDKLSKPLKYSKHCFTKSRIRIPDNKNFCQKESS